MKLNQLSKTLACLISILSLGIFGHAQINFSSSGLSGESLNNPTSLQFGPDGRLYVSQQNGNIYAYEVVRNGPNDYAVTSTEVIGLVKGIPNHNSDGSLNTNLNKRQVTGIMVVGTAANPVLYVSSSDPRIGGGGGSVNTNLDENSGVLSRLTWNGASWNMVHLVRGLPRSAENHALNGMDLSLNGNTLYLTAGGHTNKGAPSNNFTFLPEFAYSAAILAIDLNAIDALPTQTDAQGQQYKYDLPTLDDEDKANVANPTSGYEDVNDPWGGNFGKNQAELVMGGPVQIYSSGWRNHYDVLITQGGRMYTFDNGPNSGWGGTPINCTNSTNESNSQTKPDNLHFVSGPGYYGGHPNPTRANRANTFNTTNPQTPIPMGMEDQFCDYRNPGNGDGALATINSSTNGLCEYTASNFGGVLQGNLLAAAFNGNIYRFELNAAGNMVVNQSSLASGFGATPLDVIAQGDNDPFPGTVWACTYGADNITIFEPQDFQICTGTDSSFTLDSDGDGYSNGDELANGTDQCNASNIPNDFDQDFLSDLIDNDDDNDGINDVLDLFARDKDNGATTTLPVSYLFDNSVDPGINGWGFTGTMVDNVNDYMNLYDDGRMTVGGAALKFTIDSVESGDARAALNNQRYAFQFGMNIAQEVVPFTVEGRVMGPFANVSPVNDMSQGMYIGSGDQDNYLKIVCHANGGNGGIEVLYEVGGSTSSTIYNVPGVIGAGSVELFLNIDPTTREVQPAYSFSQGPATNLGPKITLPQAWLNNVLAVGFIATSRNAPQGFAATWDYITVTRNANTALGQWHDVPYNSAPPTKRHENSFVQVGDKFYLIGGRGNKPVQIFNLADSTWTNGATPPVEIHHFQAVEYQGMIWCVGAMNGGFPTETPLPNIYIYDPVSDTWHLGPSIPAARRRGSAGVVVHNDEIYLVSGIINGHQSGWVTWLDKFDPLTNTWTILADAPRARDHWQAQLANGKIYAVGGRRSGAQGTFNATVSEVDIYDIASNTWTTLPAAQNLPTKRAAGVVGILGDEIIYAGGESGTQSTAHEETEALDLNTNTWRSLSAMLDSRHGTSAITNNGGIWVAAGSGNRGGAPELNTMETFFFSGKRQPLGTPTVAGTFASNPTSHDYGAVVVGDSSTQNFTLTNSNGNQGVVITGLNYTGDPDFSDNFPLNLPVVLPAGASISFDITFVPSALGARVGALEIATTQTGSPLTIPLNGEGINLSPLYRVNAGGPAYSTIGGDPFSADAFFSGGNTSSTGNAIAGTIDDVLYQTERWGNFSYNFPISSPGLYEVRLHFAEIWNGGQSNGTRVFTMALEGSNVLSNYDIFADVGGFTASVKTFQVAVADGSLDLTVTANANNPKISAIEVYSAGSIPVSNLAANPDPLHFFSQQIATTSAPQDLTIRNTGINSVDVTGISVVGADAADFAVTFSGPISIPGGDSILVPFTFSPSTVGLKTASASIVHTGGNSPFSVALTGEAINQNLTVTANVLQKPTCAGGNDGVAVATVVNGISPFQYLWTPSGQTSATASSLSEGIYTIRVIDSANDTAFAQVTLTADTLLVSVDACRDQSAGTGQAWATVSGGLPPYTYLWSANAGSSTNDSVFGLSNGSYTVTVTDGNSCAATATVLLDNNVILCDTCALPVDWANQDVGAVGAPGDVCYNSQTQEFTVSGSGSDIWGTADEFQFAFQSLIGDGEIIARVTAIQNTNQWSKAGVMMRADLSPGAQEVMMLKRGANGYSWQYRTAANSTTAYSGNVNATTFPLWVRVVRAGNTFTGYHSVDGISWTQQGAPQTIAMPNTLFVGLAVTSHNDGVINTSVFDNVQVIPATSSLGASASVVSNFNGADVSCAGAMDGTALASASGGLSPYSYQWDANAGNQTANVAIALGAGTYSVTVTDANNATAVANVTVTEPAAVTASAVQTQPASAPGQADGAATLTPGGGTPPYTYQWDANAGNQTTATATSLTNGTYGVTVTDANGCLANDLVVIDTFTILPPFALRINAGGPQYVSTANDTFVPDVHFVNGSVFNKNQPIANTLDDALYQTERYNANLQYAIPVPAGNYDVVLHFAEIYVGVQGGGSSLGAGARLFDAIVEGDTIFQDLDLFATYGPLTAFVQTTYNVPVTDGFLNLNFPASVNNGKISAIEILETGTDPLMLSLSSPTVNCGFNISCNGASDGVATASVNGGTGPYTYQWDAAANNATTATVNALAAGSYVVTVTDALQATVVDTITLTAPTALVVTTNVDSGISCNGDTDGQVSAAVSGGCAPYTYLWSANAGNATTPSVSSLAAGTYTVTVTDTNACSMSATVSISEPAPLAMTLTSTTYNCGFNLTCNGAADGSITAVSSGGTAPYSYLWGSAFALRINAGGPTFTNTNNETYLADQNFLSPSNTYSNNTIPDILNTVDDVLYRTERYNSNLRYRIPVPNGTYNVVLHFAEIFVGAQGGNLNKGVGDRIFSVSLEGQTLLNNYDLYADVGAGFATQKSAVVTVSDDTLNIDMVASVDNAKISAIEVISVGDSNATLSGLSAGTYNVTVTDAKGCDVQQSITLSEPTPLAATLTANDVSCAGFADGSIAVSATGGCAPYAYAWDANAASQTTATATALGPGTYNVTITDANGCATTATATLSQPAALQVMASVSSATTAPGASDGVASTSVTGGTPAFSYLWSNSQTGATATGLSAGTYTVTVTDANGCTATDTVLLVDPVAPISIATSSIDVSCNGGNNGQATASASGGVAAYSYLWSNGQTTGSATGLVAGVYTVTVTDQNNTSATAQVTISEPTALVLNATTSSFNCGYNVSCNGANDGAITLSTSGGTAPYRFVWNNAPGVRINCGGPTFTSGVGTVFSADQNFGTPSATYTNNNIPDILGTDDDALYRTERYNANLNYAIPVSNGDHVVILHFTELYFGAPGGGPGGTNRRVFDLSLEGQLVLDDLDMNALVTPGTAIVRTFVTNVSDGILNINCAASVNNAKLAAIEVVPVGTAGAALNNLVAGNYGVTVIDSNGCSTSANYTLSEPDPLTLVLTGNDVSCNGQADGSATSNINGGCAPYTYTWSNSQATPVANNLAGGTYSLTVSDDNGCTAVGNVVINEPAILALNASVDNNVSCNGANDGQAIASPSGGQAPYTFSWSNGQTTATATNLNAGGYTVTLTDAGNCTAIASVTITEPLAISVTTVIDSAVSCANANNGQVTASATAGTAPYAFAWSNGQTTATATGLVAGTYTVTVTDANNCSQAAMVTLGQPNPVVPNATVVQNVSCGGGNNGSAATAATGGTAPYTYLWSNGFTTATNPALNAGTHYVTVTDANNCSGVDSIVITEPTAIVVSYVINSQVTCYAYQDGSVTASATGGTPPYSYLWSTNAASQTTATAQNLSAGNYVVTVTDANGCTTAQNVTVTQPGVLLLAFSINSNVTCFGGNDGSASALVFGGTPPYVYQWGADANNQTASTANNLTAGVKNLTVTDANGCVVTGSVTLQQPAQMVATATVNNNVSCFGFSDGSVTISTTGGTPGYAYAWPASAGGQLSASVNNLSAGTYTVQVRDSRFCADSVTVTITEPTQIVASAVADNNVSCNGAADGQATVTATGGTAPYSYTWNANAASQTTATATGLAAGVYTVTVTDANNCVTVDAVSITEPTALTATAVVDNNAACGNGPTGQATASANGGTAPYTFAWSNGQPTAIAANLVSGTYAVTVTDANGCTATDSVTITAPSALTASLNVDNNVSCNGAADGQVTASVSVGTAPFTYLWSDNQTNATATGLAAGTYSVTITDLNACSATLSVAVTEPAALVVGVAVDSQPTCGNGNDGQATVSVSGGTAPYTYLWSDNQATATASNLSGGTYTVTVTDANNCSGTASVNLALTGNISLVVAGQDVSCDGATDGQATATPSGGTAPYSYLWSNGQTTATANGLAGGTYSVTVTDSNGCNAIDTIAIGEPAPLVLTANDVSCNGDQDGSVSASGGTGPYTYSIASMSNTSANFRVRFGRDDAEEWRNGVVRRGGNDLELVFDGNNRGNQKVGMIYRGVSVPQGAMITNAYIQFTAKNTGNVNPSALTITGNDVNNARLITTTTNNISNRTRTSASVAWNPSNWTVPGQAGPNERTPDISAIIQEIVNRPGWNPGNRMCLIVEGQGRRRSMSYNGNSSQAPVLHIEWAQSTSFANSNLPPGGYTVTVTDANGCTLTQTVTVGEPAALVAAAVVDTQATCNGGAGGQATASATGGTSPYAYAWSNGQTTATATNLTGGTYTVTVSDANNCISTTSTTITQTSPNFTFTSNDASCNGGSDGCIVVGGGVPPYTYVLNGTPLSAQSGFAFSRSAAGSDDAEETVSSGGVNIVSSSLEMAEDNFAGSGDLQLVGMRFPNLNIPQGATITSASLRFKAASSNSSPTNLVIYAEDTDNAATFATSNGNISGRTSTSATVAWNNVPAWSNNQFYTAPNIASLVEEVVNRPGWSAGNALALIVSGPAGHRNADAYETGVFNAPLLTIQYALQPTLCSLSAGTYVLDVTDSTGCMVTQSITINEPSPLSLTGTDASCFGVADGSIAANGGTQPYSYQLTGLGSGSIAAQVATGADDAEETVNGGGMNLGSGSLEMGEDNFANSNDPHLVGMRFVNLAIPQGATITNAYLELTAGPTTTAPTNLQFVAEDANDAAAFSNSNSNISNRATTAASVNWNNVPAFSATQTYTTPALNSLVQAVVNRSGWQPGNALAIIVSGNGHRDAKSFNNNAAQAPRLIVEYTTATLGQTVSGLYAGGYQVTVTDANGCSLTDSVTLGTSASNCNPCVNGRVESGLLALYPFYETSGNVVHDLGGYGAPLDLTIANPGNTNWLGGNGISINSSTIIQASTSASKIATACGTTNEITVEAWVSPDNTTQGGPSRIVSYSPNTSQRNWTLGQQASAYIGRVRSTNSSPNGIPDLSTGTGVVQSNTLQHVVMTRTAAGVWTLYVDGIVEATGTRTGNFGNWNANYPFSLANEATRNRTWLGDMFLVAVYERALTPVEIAQNLLAGPDCSGNFPPIAACSGEVQVCSNGLEVSFDGSASSDPDGSITTYAWDFGDGNTGTGSNVMHSYASAGTYTATLVVTDNNGQMDTCQTQVAVSGQTVGRVSAGLIALYPFFETNGGVVHDASGFQSPLDLQISDVNAVSWLPGSALRINSGTILKSGTATKVHSACSATNELTVEAWVKPANTSQGGPSRIASMSVNPNNRNFTLAQEGQQYRSRIRTTTSTANGTPDLSTGNDVTTNLQHVVFTRNAAGAWVIYVDGQVEATGTRTGDFSTWNNAWTFMLANELTENRDWLGEMHLVALYNVALSANEINQNFAAGPDCSAQLQPFSVFKSQYDACGSSLQVFFDGSFSSDADGSIVSYTWDFGDGNTGTGAFPSHTYAAAGTYTVTLTVTDNDQLSTTSSETVALTAGGRVGSGLIAYYPFTEGAGNTVADQSGFGAPLDLTVANPGNVSWLPGNGMKISAPTILQGGNGTKIAQACGQTNEITVEAWVRPDNLSQTGPARIVTLSRNTGQRNFTLGQQRDEYRGRLRTTSTGGNGTPDVSSGGIASVNSVQHVVMTRDAAGNYSLYLDGVVVYTGTRTGTFNNWNNNYAFALVNELSRGRAWRGEMYQVAVYDNALSASQVNQNFSAGPNCTSVGSAKASVAAEAMSSGIGTAPIVEAYPNPFKDAFILTFSSQTRYGQLNVKVYDQFGKEVTQQNFLPDDGRYLEAEIDLSNVTNGVYVLVVRAGDFSKRIRIIKQ